MSWQALITRDSRVWRWYKASATATDSCISAIDMAQAARLRSHCVDGNIREGRCFEEWDIIKNVTIPQKTE